MIFRSLGGLLFLWLVDFDLLGQFVELSGLSESDDELGVDLLSALSTDVLASDCLDDTKAVLLE